MKENPKPVDTSQDYTQFISGSFFQHLAQNFPEVQSQKAELLAQAKCLLEEQQHLLTDEAARQNLSLSSMVLVCYRTLLNESNQKDLIVALKQALCEPSRQGMLHGTRKMLTYAPDPFAATVEVSKEKEKHMYGPSFEFEALQDDQHVYLLNVKRCLWHQFFVEQGVAELTHIFCAFDLSWMDAIEPERHGFRIERPTTLGWGHDQCRFWHIRTE